MEKLLLDHLSVFPGFLVGMLGAVMSFSGDMSAGYWVALAGAWLMIQLTLPLYGGDKVKKVELSKLKTGWRWAAIAADRAVCWAFVVFASQMGWYLLRGEFLGELAMAALGVMFAGWLCAVVVLTANRKQSFYSNPRPKGVVLRVARELRDGVDEPQAVPTAGRRVAHALQSAVVDKSFWVNPGRN